MPRPRSQSWCIRLDAGRTAKRVWLMETQLALPRAVLEQAAAAEARHLEILGNTGHPAPAAPQVTPPTEQVPATPEAPAIAVQAQVEAAPVVQSADQWELKYKVLNGKYQKEVPRMAQEIRELTDQLRVATSATPASPAAVVAEAHTSGMTPETVKAQYGDDFADAVAAIADARSNKLRDDLSSKVQAIEVDTAERRRGDFIADLTRFVPTWSVIDSNPGFTAYLDEIDPQTGRARREFFSEADRHNDAARVASFFTAFSGNNKPAPVATAAEPAPSVEHLISPDSSRHSEAPEGKKLWSKAEINRFYADSRAQGGSKPYGRYTAAEYERIDTDISAAAAEGRYIG